MIHNNGVRVAIYTRVSTDKQEVENQLLLLKDFCNRRGWVITGEYVDAGVSSVKTDRPGLEALLKDAFHGCFDVVLVFKLDRLARSLSHLITIMDTLRSYNIDIVTSDGQIDTTTPQGRLLWQILGAFAEFERNLITDRIKAAYKRKKAQAESLGKKPRWGRRSVLTRGQVEEALSLREKNYSWSDIAKVMGIPKTTIYRSVKAFQKPLYGNKNQVSPINTIIPESDENGTKEGVVD